jgi:hypothetical protein
LLRSPARARHRPRQGAGRPCQAAGKDRLVHVEWRAPLELPSETVPRPRGRGRADPVVSAVSYLDVRPVAEEEGRRRTCHWGSPPHNRRAIWQLRFDAKYDIFRHVLFGVKAGAAGRGLANGPGLPGC